MSISINVPEDLYQQAVAIAEAHHVPVDEVFASAFAEQLASWQRLRERAARGNRGEYFAVLATSRMSSLTHRIEFEPTQMDPVLAISCIRPNRS